MKIRRATALDQSDCITRRWNIPRVVSTTRYRHKSAGGQNLILTIQSNCQTVANHYCVFIIGVPVKVEVPTCRKMCVVGDTSRTLVSR